MARGTRGFWGRLPKASAKDLQWHAYQSYQRGGQLQRTTDQNLAPSAARNPISDAGNNLMPRYRSDDETNHAQLRETLDQAMLDSDHDDIVGQQ